MIKRISVSDRRRSIAYPSFPEGYANNDSRMNGFYETLANYAREASEGLTDDCSYFAEYTAEETEDTVTVSYTVRVRSHGKSIFTRRFSHTWRDGLIVSVSL